MRFAEDPELTITLYLEPKNFEKSFSNCFTPSPIVYISLAITLLIASISFSSQVDDANGYFIIGLYF